MLEAVLAFLAGLLIGSFLNVCVFRLPRDLSVVRPRSFCPECERQIAWYDNIPLVSYGLLGARCRHCKARIPLRYPLVELATGAAFALCVAFLGVSWPAAKFAIFSAILITLIASDFEERILPDEFTLGGAAVGVALAAVVPLEAGIVTFFLSGSVGPRMASVAESCFSAGVAGGAIWLVGWLYLKIRHREGMGLGDVKMIAMLGAFLGFQETLLTLIMASIAGTVTGGLYVLITRKEMSTYELPFGSFIGLAGLVMAFWGHVLMR